jgi:hypothetical protein
MKADVGQKLRLPLHVGHRGLGAIYVNAWYLKEIGAKFATDCL